MPEHTPAPTPSRAVYGFVMFLSFNIFFLVYLVWAIVPETYFEQIGIDFLPQRHWAVSIPIYFLTVLAIFAFLIYPSLGLLMTPDIDDLQTITDEVGSRRKKNGMKLHTTPIKGDCVCKDKENCWKEYYELRSEEAIQKKIPVVKDLDIWDVSEHLYL
ncbi:unnamed protein product [Ceutorhynchus assimilis]|uniref:PIG-P domain-containing protein n=1 Tax=Ceutorhynchus assimilis TaxID=467358 RepID=A0A9N9QQ65_9CUCU|nr:unnamed protein product [Ceutorhynchus assimilis]